MKNKPRTPAQIAASRANGSKSQGPKTEEGKQRSSSNALKHGLSAKTLCLNTENPSALEELRERYIRELQPEGQIELDLVEEIVAARWRMRRLWTLETAMLDLETDRQAVGIKQIFEKIDPPTRIAAAFEKLADEGNTLYMLDRYEARHTRSYHRALKTLLRLLDHRRAPDPPLLHPTAAMHTAADEKQILQNEPKPSPANGFDRFRPQRTSLRA
jgi:hypothetical protein